MDSEQVVKNRYMRKRNGDTWQLGVIIIFSILLGAAMIYFLLIYRCQLLTTNCVDAWCSKMWFGE
jgi:hypothetical protein